MSSPGSTGVVPERARPEESSSQSHLVRFGPSEILLHWALVLPYLTLAASGILLIVEKNLGLDWASRELLREVHLFAGVSLVLLPSLVLMGTHPRPHLNNLREAFEWHWRDLRWLYSSGLRLLFPRTKLPPAGRFNAGQRLNLLHVILFMPALIGTGTAIWLDGADVLLLRLVHVGLAALSLFLAAGHMYLALFHPSTRPARGAMFHGRVSADYARSHHPLWHESITGVAASESVVTGRRVSVFGLSLGAVLLTIVLMESTSKHLEVVRDSLEIYAFLAPGPLHPLHADVPELVNCGGCHAPFGGVSSESCLECHEEVARRLDTRSGFHGTLEGDCSGCHRDHVSRLMAMEDQEFNHDIALFRLEGAHRDLDCDQCHEGDDGSRDYLGIAHKDCDDCHSNPHDPPLQPACAHCHRQDTWNELLPSFAHDQDTSFALDTVHRSVECTGCHRRETREARPQLKGTPDTCEECHQDVVATFAGMWSGTAAVAPSPHYREVRCVECHRTEPREEIARCSACHPADYDRLFVDWQARVERELLGVDDTSGARHWRRRGKHHWESVVDWLRRRSGRGVDDVERPESPTAVFRPPTPRSPGLAEQR